MFRIPRIEKSEFYLEQAIKAMELKAQTQKQLISKKYSKITKDRKLTTEDYNFRKRKELENIKIETLNVKIKAYLKKLIAAFPRQEHLDKIYIKLINSSEINFSKIETALEQLELICFECDVLTSKTLTKIKEVRTQKTCNYIVQKHLGKVSKQFKKNSSAFDSLSLSKQFINELPTFDKLYTVAIAGFPNVGKSTLMQKMSGSNVEIQNYPFTTKGLMFGYLIDKGNKHVQLIDTPGLLGREHNNLIEKKASIVINDYCEKIVFVIDITESCGYKLTKQLELLNNIIKTKKEIIIYLSKIDIYNSDHKKNTTQLKKKYSKLVFYDDSNSLKDILIASSYIKGFDIKSIAKI